ncbi:MAG: YjgP/YjgQ family permease [Planctomycetes bacterium]|nr:YjgP/YjgQ family permease [Planctomycetota bacterium]
MFFTLQRYIFRDLLRIFILATVGLTLILSLGGILQPVQQYGVGPRQVVNLLVYFLPITLTFVLPMAALFASALTYGRFAVDNELDACRASGVALPTLIYPGFVLALLVAIANLLLSFHVMPYFMHRAESSLKADAKRILFRNLQRKGFYRLSPDGKYLLYADYVDPKNDTLFGIVAVQHEPEGVKRIITAEMTRVQIDPHDRFNEVQLAIHNARQIGAPADDDWVRVGSMLLKTSFESLLTDKIKFKKVDEMKQIRADLMRFNPVAKIARTAYGQLATEALARDMAETWRAAPGSFYALPSGSGTVRISATACALDKPQVITLTPPVLVREYDDRTGQCLRRLRCERANLHVEDDPAQPRLGLDLRGEQEEETSPLVHYVLGDLSLPATIRRELERDPILQTLTPDRTAALLGAPPSSLLAGQQAYLRTIINKVLTDLASETNSRLVFGIGCIPMILIGIGLGILQKGGHLLGAFGVSCLPAALLGAAILGGKHLIKGVAAPEFSGILVMWAGLGLLGLLAAVVYRRLLRQ